MYSDYLSLGFILVIIGVAFFAIVWVLLHAAARSHPNLKPPAPPAGSLLPEHGDAVMTMEPGGRLRTMNDRARQMFHLQEGEAPQIERLARRIRPSEALLNLCAAEGQARFVLEGRVVEGTSYRVESKGEAVVLVSMRYPELLPGSGSRAEGLGSYTLQTFTELTQEMAASLDLEQTLSSVMSNIEKLMPADFLCITIWDSENEYFIPYRYAGLLGFERHLEVLNQHYTIDNSLSGRLYRTQVPLLLGDITVTSELYPLVELLGVPLRSFLGFPLLVGNEFIGTLEIGSFSPETFGEQNLDLVRLLSGQATIALHNALLYHQEKQRSAELSGLARLTQAFGPMRDPSSFYARLVESVVPLLRVDILGFLIYNENTHVLEGKIPFHGIPDQVVELYRAQVLSGSAAEQILLRQDLLMTDNASEDERWSQLGLIHVARAASLRETVLIPLAAGGHMMGYVQASNHTGEDIPFTQPELHLLMIIANQAASIIENASLVQQSRQRAQRAEALRRIANLASSTASIDEILKFSLQELAHLLHSEVAAIFLIHQGHGFLELHRASIITQLPELPERLTHLMVEDPQYHFTVTDSQHVFTSGHISEGTRAIIPFYQSILEFWKIESAEAVPLVVRNEGIGELWFGSSGVDFFDPLDLQAVSTAAGQIASVIEQSFLSSQTDESLRRRVEQMTAITRISRELSTSLDLNNVLQLVYDEALRTTRADCGTILLFDMERKADPQAPLIRFYVGDLPEPVLSPIQRCVMERDTPQMVTILPPDESKDDTSFLPPHAGIQSMLVVPISSQQQRAGLICLHGKNINQFDQTSLEITQSLAIQASVAINNALVFEEQARRGALLMRELNTLSSLIEVTRSIRPTSSIEKSLSKIANAIQTATPFQVVLISMFDAGIQAMRRMVSVGMTPEMWEEASTRTQPWHGIQQLLQPEFRVGEAYYVPGSKLPAVPDDVHTINVLPYLNKVSEESWDPDDLLFVPLYDSAAYPLGLVSVDAPRDHRQPDKPAYEALELFAAQAGLVMERYQRTSSLENELKQMGVDQERLHLSLKQAQSNLPVLLHKELDQTVSLHNLNQRIDRVRASLEIASLANRQESREGILHTLASELLIRFSMQVALVAERSSSGFRLVDVLGSFPPGTNPEALFGQRNPLRQILSAPVQSEDGILLVSSLDSAPEWQNSTLFNVLEAHSMIGIRVDMGNDLSAGVLVIGQRTLPAFLEEDHRVFSQLAYQVSVGLQNLQLLNETRRRLQEVNLLLEFTRKLGSLKPEDILTSLIESISQVLPDANTGWVGIWDEAELAIVPQAAVGYTSRPDILGIHYSQQSPAGDGMDSRVVLPLRVFHTGRSERVAEIHFASQYHLGADDLMRYRRATGGRLPLSALLIPLQIGENGLGVVCLENFETQGAFTEEDEALAFSFTGQAAMALENARLYQASQQRAVQLKALTMVAGTITSSLQREELILVLLDQLKIVVPYNTATLWLRQEDTLTVAAANGFADNDSRLNLTVDVKDSLLLKTMIHTNEPITIGDVRSDPRFPSLLEPEYLSWLGIPLIYKSEVIGVIALEKQEVEYYSSEIVQAATTFAGQAAVSLENARLYAESKRRAAELDERSQRLALLNRLSGDLVSSLDVDHIFKLIGQQLMSAVNAAGVAALIVQPDGQCILQVEVPPRDEVLPVNLPPTPLFERLRESQGIFLSDDAMNERELAPIAPSFLQERQVRSLLLSPLVAGSALQGWFLVYRQEADRFNSSEIELARTICNQVAIAIQNARLFIETRRLTEDLERRVEERTHELRREHANSQTLLHIITELSASLDMNLVLSRTLAVLNDSVGAEESAIILAQGTQVQHRAGLVLMQPVPGDAQAAPVELQIAHWVIQSRQPVVVSHVQADGRWEITAGYESAYQSVLAVPLVMGEQVLGGLLLVHRQAGFFNPDQIGLMEATARQIGIALSNAELFNLIRDQSEHLGSMLREQQIEASRSRAILEAVADGVLVTNAGGLINLFNASAERILSLKSNEVIGKSLDTFVGLFGKTAADWMQTIRSWSKDPLLHQNAETYSERIGLDNGNIVAVHLSPVFWRSEFLGTVSIFRDITHEVQVDRIKSEFVANVSHELRTPMTSIKGYVEIMLMGVTGQLNPQQEHFLRIVQSNTERLSELVNDLLDVSRIEAGRLVLNFQPLDMREIADDVVADLKRRSSEENRPMTITLEIPAGLSYALGDSERIRQVLSSLVNNSYNYTPDGGRVTVKISETDQGIRVDVKDNGIGIQPTEAHRIFERFYRGEDPMVLATSGFGLGLAIARTLVEMHHGKIWFSSTGKRGEGSVFSFTLPVYKS